jgi:hypothetical protein
MSVRRIDDDRRTLYEKLRESLAGPFEAFLPLAWLEAAMAETGRSFRESAFSPLRHALGDDRAIA